MKKTLRINSKQEMAEFAREIAQNLNATFKFPRIICLNGTLGVGKTFFAKEFIGSLLEKKQEVTSPTFNLLNVYDSVLGEIFHFDLYRLKGEEELENIGFFDAISNANIPAGITEIGSPLFKGFDRKENDFNNHFQIERADALAQQGGLPFPNICLIEWPEKSKKYLSNYFDVEIKMADGEAREIITKEIRS